MMGLVSNFGKWLDSRFPDKVVVTESSYLTLLARTESGEKMLQAQDTRIKNLCKEVVEIAKKTEEIAAELNKLKVATAFKQMSGTNINSHFQQGMPPITASK